MEKSFVEIGGEVVAIIHPEEQETREDPGFPRSLDDMLLRLEIDGITLPDVDLMDIQTFDDFHYSLKVPKQFIHKIQSRMLEDKI